MPVFAFDWEPLEVSERPSLGQIKERPGTWAVRI